MNSSNTIEHLHCWIIIQFKKSSSYALRSVRKISSTLRSDYSGITVASVLAVYGGYKLYKVYSASNNDTFVNDFVDGFSVIFLKINSRRPQNSLMRRHPVGTA